MKLDIDLAEVEANQQEEKQSSSLRAKRREYAQKRKQLGFNDKGKEEIDDKIIEELEYKSKEYLKQIEE